MGTLKSLMSLICSVFGAVVGCGEVELSQGAFQRRDGSDVIVGCMTSDQTWRLKCVDNTWTGLVGNCSHCE